MTMGTYKNKANKHTPRTVRGFSTVEMLIMVTIVTIVTGFGVMGISQAKASIRLSGAAREYASYIEKARTFSIRSHADDANERASITINADQTSYNVTMDLDGDGDLDTKTITLPDGVSFVTVETIAFDWRGRTWNTVDGNTESNAQVSITLKNSAGKVSVDVTGSGDVTVDSKVFDDKVPNVSLHVADLVSGATPTPTPAVVATATPTPEVVATPDVTINPTPTPTPMIDLGDILPTPTPTVSPTPSPTATPTPAPTATPTPTPTVCTINADQIAVIMSANGTATIKVSHNASVSLTITGTSSKPSALQVSAAQTVAAGASANFTIKSKGSIGIYSVTFSTSCGSKTVPVTVLL